MDGGWLRMACGERRKPWRNAYSATVVPPSLAQRFARNAERLSLAVWQTGRREFFALPMSPTTHPARRARLHGVLREARDFIVSLKLTLVLLAFSMVLIFAATLDQVNLGIWTVQEKYFRSFVIYIQVGPFTVPAFPGGYAVGGLLLANLIAAHVYRFAFTWRKAGIQIVHFGLIVLLVGELLTGFWQQDAHMRLSEGETKNYAESFRDHELVLINTSNSTFDDVVAIPEKLLARKTAIQHAKLPFRVVPKVYYPNSTLVSRTAENSTSEGGSATKGFADHVTAAPQEITYRPNERNVPSAMIELVGADGSLGTWLVSTQLSMPQEFRHENSTWRIALRIRRSYQPFSLTLLKFSHERYAGTDIPKNFSSRLRVNTPDGRDDREVLIYMNNPLRYAGLTFYQAGFENDDRTTILQVVRNPSWALPYVACALMTLGLMMQFGMHLVAFLAKQTGARAMEGSPPRKRRDDLRTGGTGVPALPSRATPTRGAA
jgi:hypothetical protein